MTLFEKIINPGKKLNNNFITIEKNIHLKKHNFINENQLNYELNLYNKKNNKNEKTFNKILLLIQNSLINTKIYSKEENFIKYLLNLNRQLIKETNDNSCHIFYSSQLITNWIFLSLNTNFVDKTYFSNEKMYFNKYDLVNKISNYFNMYLSFFDENFNNFIKNKNEIKHISFTIFNILSKNELFDNKYIQLKIIKKNKKGLRTHQFISLKEKIFTDNNIDFNIYLNEPRIIIINNRYFLGGCHYSTFYKIFKANSKSNKTFKLNNKNLISKMCSLSYIIDFNFYNKIYNLICEDLNIDRNEMSLENYIKKNLNNIYNSQLFNEIEYNQSEGSDDEDVKKVFQQKYNKLLTYYIFVEIKKKLINIKQFYLTLHFDFRGRVYPRSCISPTGPKLFRYLYYYGYYTDDEIKKLKIRTINDKQKKIIQNCELLKTYNNINLENEISLFYLYLCLFEIGKIFKNELSSEKNGICNDIDLLEFGNKMIYKIINNEIKLNFDEKLEYLYILSGLEDLNKGLYKKLILYKDATASGIQLLTVVLGGNNEEILKNCNLRSYDSWYDTYLYIINTFVKENEITLNKITNNDYKHFIKRSDLKRSIMTYIYGAGQRTALNYYIENLPKKINEKVGIEVFNIFYKFLDEFFSSDKFFKVSSKSIINEAQEKFIKHKSIKITTTDLSVIPLDYYKIIHYRLDRIIENNRNTISFINVSDSFDEIKTFRSLIANITQSLDALFLRLVILELDYPIITIHDSFGIDILNVDYIIDVANISINKIYYSFEINKNFKLNNYFSIYILL